MNNLGKRLHVSFTTSLHTNSGNDIEGSSVVSFSVSSVWIIDWIQEVQTGRPTHQVESPTASCTQLSLSLSLSPTISVSFSAFCVSSVCFLLILSDSHSPALSFSLCLLCSSLPPTLHPSLSSSFVSINYNLLESRHKEQPHQAFQRHL